MRFVIPSVARDLGGRRRSPEPRSATRAPGPSLTLGMTLLFLACTACKPAQPAVREPQMRATVVTIRTTIQPDNKTFTHTIVIANDRARSTDELDFWRLFDTKANTVTFVDDATKTVRTETFDLLLKKHRQAIRADLPSHYPRARVTRTDKGVLIEVG